MNTCCPVDPLGSAAVLLSAVAWAALQTHIYFLLCQRGVAVPVSNIVQLVPGTCCLAHPLCDIMLTVAAAMAAAPQVLTYGGLNNKYVSKAASPAPHIMLSAVPAVLMVSPVLGSALVSRLDGCCGCC